MNVNRRSYGCSALNCDIVVPKLKILEYNVFSRAGITSIYAPEVSSVQSEAAPYCVSLKNVTIGDIEEIGVNAFISSSLEHIVWNSIKAISHSAFEKCYSLKTIGSLEDIEELGMNVFWDCKELTGDIKMPNLVGELQQLNFYNTKITSLDIPQVTVIRGSAVAFCKHLTRVNMPSVVELYNDAFSGCSSLVSIDLSGVETFGSASLSKCVSLTTVDLHNVKSLSDSVFASCTGLTSVIIRTSTPPVLNNSNAFYNTNDCPIYVPDASVEAYKAASNWSALASRIRPLSEYVEPSNEE
jgi:hypothetical protein